MLTIIFFAQLILGPLQSQAQVAGTPGSLFHHKPQWVHSSEGNDMSGTNTSSVSTFAFTSPTNCSDLMVCWVEYLSTSTSVSTVHDSSGNIYTFIQRVSTAAQGASLEMWYSYMTSCSANPFVTVTFGTAFTGMKGVSCHEYTGVTNPVLDNSNVNSTTVTSGGTASTTLTTNYPHELIFVAGLSGGMATPGAGFIQRSNLNDDIGEEMLVGPPAAYSPSFTVDVGPWEIIAAGFKSK